jgi:medium-chain acyl-[acyl-carrier-protein] hydrolase
VTIHAAAHPAWLPRTRRTQRARLRLFCFPYAGGGTAVYHGWRAALEGVGIDVCPVQLPGRGSRLHEAPHRRIGSAVEELVAGIGPYLDLPVAFFGHSMGALIAYELARALRRRLSVEPCHLFVSGRRAPHVAHAPVPIEQLDERALIDEVERLEGTPPEVLRNHELLQLVLPTLRADFALCETYAHAPGLPLRCPLTAFGGLDDPQAARDDVEAWREHTAARFTLRMLPGGHFFINHSAETLIGIVARELSEVGVQGGAR